MNVKDFLGESNTLGIDIWEKKYRFENESFEEFLDRITGSNPDMKRLVLAKKFIYAGRILANRGLQDKGIKVTYSNCFTPDAEVLTEVGYKKITDVQVGDKVLTIDGTFQPVNHLLVSDFDGDLVVFESPSLKGTIKATPNHPMHTNAGWVNAEEVYSIHCSDSEPLKLTSVHDVEHRQKDKIVSTLTDYSVSREYYSGKVYNLSVENNHNYVVNGVLVHNRYVITPPEDSIESIYETDYKLARTYSMGGGCGVDISKLSPNGARVRNAAKTTSGVVS